MRFLRNTISKMKVGIIFNESTICIEIDAIVEQGFKIWVIFEFTSHKLISKLDIISHPLKKQMNFIVYLNI